MGNLDDAVVREISHLFHPHDVNRVQKLLSSADLPLADDETRVRVHLATLLLANRDLGKLLELLAMAETDWRDVLMAAGLAHDNWREVLNHHFLRVPGKMD
jgi:hypothetical protein